MEEHIKTALNWIGMHPHWAGVFVFFIAFAESIPFFGFIVPGLLALTAIGALIGSHVLPMIPILLCAIAGAVSGDLFAFGVGHYYKARIRKLWPLSKFPQWIDRGTKFFQSHGGKSIFLGRFVPPMRPLTPLIAGSMNMPVKNFLIADLPAAILWAPLYLLPGFFIGSATKLISTKLAIEIIILIIFILLLFWFMLRAIRRLIKYVNKIMLYTPSQNTFYHFIANPLQPTGPGQLWRLMIGSILFIGFFLFSFAVNEFHLFTALNTTLQQLMHSIYQVELKNIAAAITFAGKYYVLLPMMLIVLAWFWLRRDIWTTIHGLGLIFIVMGLTVLFKFGIDSPRPGGLLDHHDNNSFPSAHASLSFAFFLFLATIWSQKRPKHKKYLPYLIAIIAATLIALSRLYLGAHWLTDIIAGMLLGVSSYLLVSCSYLRTPKIAFPLKKFFAIVLFAFWIPWAIYMTTSYQTKNLGYTPIQAHTQ